MIRRVIGSVLVLAATVTAIATGDRLVPQPQPDAPVTTVSVTPTRQDVACPGALVTPSGATGSDELGGTATDVTAATFLTGTVRAVDNGRASDALVGATVERVGGGDIAGLAAVTCTSPRVDQWVLGGETQVGGSARLVLTNPARAAVEATVTAYGEIGEVDSRTVAIGPAAQQEVLLEGMAVDVGALAVHITATGTGVTAAMQDSRLNGFQPYGTDWVGAAAVGTDLAIPGVGTGGNDNQSTSVRLIAPDGATVRLALSTPEGAQVWEGVAALTLEPGVAVELPVPDVEVGTVTVTADAPVAAAAVTTRGRPATSGIAGDTAKDLRWIPAQPADDDLERAAVAVGHDETVVVYARRRGTFTLSDGDGTQIGSWEIAAGTTLAIPLAVEPGTVLVASGPYRWTVLVSDSAFLTATTPARTTIDAVDIAVEQRSYVPSP